MTRIGNLVAAAVLGMIAGAACGGAQTAATNPRTPTPQPAPQAAASSDKHACGNHEGAGCGAVATPPK